MSPIIRVIGAGLAGCESAWQLAKRGFRVQLFEMRPDVSTSVHKTDAFAELVCSNSLRSDDPFHPVGLIKREMAAWDSLIIAAAREAALPAGGALAVDRDRFSAAVMNRMACQPLIEVVRSEVKDLPDGPCILAAGPLCSAALSESLYRFLGDQALYFYDAIAPVLEHDSLDLNFIFPQSRYDKGDGEDYLNIPLDQPTYLQFHQNLVNAERIPAKDHEKLKFFEGCLPVEVMADRGVDTLRFGPMKPVGLTDPRTGQSPYAVIQLRQDNFAKSLWNMVGFQTQMKWGEQQRVFTALPGLNNASFVRYGMIHRNTYVNSSKHLSPTFQFRNRPELFLAGQISGVEGYVESAASGLMVGVQMARLLAGQELIPFPSTTAMGSLAHYVSFPDHKDFQPVNVNYGILAALKVPRRTTKMDKRKMLAMRAIKEMKTFMSLLGEPSACFPEYDLTETAMGSNALRSNQTGT